MTIKTSKCRSCGAEMLWARVEPSGKAMPLDAEPAPAGNVMLTGDGDEVTCRVLKAGETHDGNRYTSHHQTCPDGRTWRKS